MKRFLSTLACVAALLLAVGASAQTGSISGQVVDPDGQPIEGAKILLIHPENAGLQYGGTTNSKGKYILITGQTSGPWRLTVTKEGYQEYECPDLVRVPLGDAPLQFPVIKLWKKGAEGAPIKVTAEEAERIEQQKKEFMAVKAAFDKAVQLVDEADTAGEAGDMTTYTQKLAEAETAYNTLAEQQPDIPEIRFNLGIVKKKLQKWAEAGDAYAQAAEMRPDIEAYQGAAECYQRAGQMDKAALLLQKGVDAHPESAVLQLWLGKVLWTAGQYSEASAALTKAKELAPSDPEPLFYLGMIAVGEGKTAKCVELLQQYLAMSPQNAQNVAQAKGLIQALKK